MGDNYLERQAKNTKKRRARAAAEVNRPRLLVRPDQVIDRYTLEFSDGCELAVGETLICLPTAGGVVDVIRGHEPVGKVHGHGGGDALAAEIQSTGVGCLRVTSIDPLGGLAEIEVIRKGA